MRFQDLFTGNHGSQNFGDPTTAGAGDGGKASVINDYLSRITGAYNAITGAGQPAGPAPAPQAPKPGGPNYMLYAGIALGVVALLFLFKRK